MKASLHQSKASVFKSRKTRLIAVSLIILAAAGIGLWLFLKPKTEVSRPPIVAVEPVGTSDVNIYGEYAGRIRAQQFVVYAHVWKATSKRCFLRKAPTSTRVRPFS